MTPNGKAHNSDAFLRTFSKIQTTKCFSELYLVLGQIIASLNSETHFPLKGSECVALILFQKVEERRSYHISTFQVRTHMLIFSKDHIERRGGARIFSLPNPHYYTIRETCRITRSSGTQVIMM